MNPDPTVGAPRIEPDPPSATEHGVDLGLERIVFLSDGVFAIALTLLVIDLRVPEFPVAATPDTMASALGNLLPRIFAYALSFTIIGLYWVAHWRRFKSIARADLGLAYVNLVVLGLIALIPFPTALIGEHGDLPIAVAIYAVTLSAAGLAGSATWVYATRAGLVAPGVPKGLVGSGAIRGLAVPVVMLGSLVLLAFVSPYVVELSWLLILPVQWLLSRRVMS